MSARAARAASYLRVLKLRADGKSVSQIADATGYTSRHVSRIIADARREYDDRFGHRVA